MTTTTKRIDNKMERVSKYQINSYGTKYKGNKELKNQITFLLKGEDG